MNFLPRYLLCGLVLAAADDARGEEALVDFDREIRPILSAACFQCHGPSEDDRQADLRLDTSSGAFAARDEGPAIVPGKPNKSALIRKITVADPKERMPPADAQRQLTAAEIENIRLWIEQGAQWKQLWSLVPVAEPKLPGVKNFAWVRNEIDRFILARLEAKGLQPSPEADRATLIRRLSLDLTGLPPNEAKIDAFIADKNPKAYENLVDRLLASRHYGERMALEWLDAARFADTHGYHVDSGRHMWRWRDWVIDALNRNVPFDQFAIEQLAGDLLPEPTVSNMIATGFNRNHGINFEGGAFAEEFRVEYVVDRVHTTATVFMGLTMKCARCHDHKFDPISQKEYYQFFAMFNWVPEQGIDGASGNAVPVMKFPTEKEIGQFKILNDQINALNDQLEKRKEKTQKAQQDWVLHRQSLLLQNQPDQMKTPVDEIIQLDCDQRSDKQKRKIEDYFLRNIDQEYKQLLAERETLSREQTTLEAKVSSTMSSMVMQDMEQPRPTFVLNRGLYDQHGESVHPGLPAALPPMPEGAPANRLGLARWLVDPSHPLTARVTANRYWQMYFGTGIVKTSENFGAGGELPSHPDLLDWLARSFMQGNWNIKALQKLIVTSATYRQSSRGRPELLEKDPMNRLLARGPRFRLPAELIRDNALAISGLLVRKVGGPSVRGYQPEGLWDEVAFGIKTYSAQVYEQDHGDNLYRRGMYTFWKRSCPPPSLATFDAPEREVCTVRRERTNTPLQALVLLNNPVYVEASRAFAERIMKHGGETDEKRVAYAFRRATGRHSTASEQAVLLEEFHNGLTLFARDHEVALKLLGIGEKPRDESLDIGRLAAWTQVSRILLNLDETINKG